MSRRSARLVKKESDEGAPSLPRASSLTSKAKPTTVARNRRTTLNVKAENDVKTEDNEAPLPVPRVGPTTVGAKAGSKRRKVAPEDTKTEVQGSLATANPSTTRRRRGGLRMIAEMPVDVLFEIFQYLDPADLLSLSRAGRTLRAYMLKRSIALPWWKAAFGRIHPKPPACPDGMSLPQYANLLCGRTCFYCNCTQGLTRSWSAYVRACKKCLANDQLFVTFNKRPSIYDPEYILFEVNFPVSEGRDSPYIFLREEFEKHRRELKRLRSRKDQSKYDAYVQDAARVRRLARARTDFSQWDAREKAERERELEARRADRKNAVLLKLKELGYSDLVERFGSREFLKIPGVNAVTLLTDKEWERVKPGILAALDNYQTDINCTNRRKLISGRTELLKGLLRASLSQNRHLDLPEVPSSQLAKLEPFRTIIYDTPEDKELKVKTLMKHFDDIPAALQAWKEGADEALLGIMQAPIAPHDWPIIYDSEEEREKKKGSKGGKKGKAPALGTEALNLATTIFWCKWCGKDYPMTYPSVLTHHCFFERHPADRASCYIPNRNPRLREIDRHIVYRDDEDKADANPGWNQGGDQIIFFRNASKFAGVMASALGQDPTTVTWEELDKANHRLECLYCRLPKSHKEKLKGLAMDWRQAILHQLKAYDHHYKIDFQVDKAKRGVLTWKNSWKKLDAQMTKKAFEKELGKDGGGTPTRFRENLCCTACQVVKIKPDGRIVESASKRNNAVEPQSKKCREGHELEKTGTYTNRYNPRWQDQSFRAWPHPVKIP